MTSTRDARLMSAAAFVPTSIRKILHTGPCIIELRDGADVRQLPREKTTFLIYYQGGPYKIDVADGTIMRTNDGRIKIFCGEMKPYGWAVASVKTIVADNVLIWPVRT